MFHRVLYLALLHTVSIYGGDIVEFDENFDMTWSVSAGRMFQPKCVTIPKNMTLCHNIGYTTMRIPNLLEHDNLEEAINQASNWNALIGIRCHPNTQVFLCSLFSPVCLERVVYPCKSLCEGVQKSCEGYMKRYGFPWPDMFRCDKFPDDTDLCMQGPSGSEQTLDDRVCKPCQEPDTYEGIIDNYCKTQYVIRATIKGLNTESSTAEPGEIEVNMGKRKKRFYKRDSNAPRKISKLLTEKDTKIYISQGIGCTCDTRITPGEHHLMGIRAEEKYDRVTGHKVTRFYADFITSWNEEGETRIGIKKALRAIRKNDNVCDGGVDSLIIHKQVEEDDSERETRKREKKERRLRHKVEDNEMS